MAEYKYSVKNTTKLEREKLRSVLYVILPWMH